MAKEEHAMSVYCFHLFCILSALPHKFIHSASQFSVFCNHDKIGLGVKSNTSSPFLISSHLMSYDSHHTIWWFIDQWNQATNGMHIHIWYAVDNENDNSSWIWKSIKTTAYFIKKKNTKRYKQMKKGDSRTGYTNSIRYKTMMSQYWVFHFTLSFFCTYEHDKNTGWISFCQC